MKLLVFVFILFLSQIAFAGPIVSGGGYGVLCEKDNIASLKVLDLYEAEHRYQLNLLSSAQSIKENYDLSISNIKRLFKNIDPLPFSQAESAYEWFFKNAEFKNDITRIKDVGHTLALEENCKLVQIATFHDNQLKVEINSELWKLLSVQDKSALIIHELLYRQFRELGFRTSEEVRADVACSFSKDCAPNFKKDETVFSFERLTKDKKSQNNTLSFINNDQGVEILLQQVGGKAFFSLASVQFTDKDLVLAIHKNKIISCDEGNYITYLGRIKSTLIPSRSWVALKCDSLNPAQLIIRDHGELLVLPLIDDGN